MDWLILYVLIGLAVGMVNYFFVADTVLFILEPVKRTLLVLWIVLWPLTVLLWVLMIIEERKRRVGKSEETDQGS